MTSTKKHILFIVPDGVGIKNFLYSDIIKILKSECEITIWSTLPLEAFKDVERIHKLKFNYKNIILLIIIDIKKYPYFSVLLIKNNKIKMLS